MTDVSRAIVRADYLQAILPFISTDETRYYLRGVYIEPHPVKGALLVATDGKMLAVIRDIDGVVEGLSKTWAVPDFVKSVKAYTKEKTNKLVPGWHHYVSMDMVEPDQRTTKVRVFQFPIGSKPDEIADFAARAKELPFDDTNKFVVDGTFPQYRFVVPASRPQASLRSVDAWFDAGLLVRMAKFAVAVAKANCQTTPPPVQVIDMGRKTKEEGTGPFLMRISGSDHQAFVVVMPMHGDAADLEADGSRIEGAPPWFYEQPTTPSDDPPAEPEELEPEIPLVAAQADVELEVAA